MSARRAFLRSMALLPAALKPVADALAANSANISGAMTAPLAAPNVNDVPVGLMGGEISFAEQAARKTARKMMGVFERRNDRRHTGQLAGIDLDLWAIRSYSPTYRAMRQCDRRDADHAETRPWRKVIGWIGVEDEE